MSESCQNSNLSPEEKKQPSPRIRITLTTKQAEVAAATAAAAAATTLPATPLPTPQVDTMPTEVKEEDEDKEAEITASATKRNLRKRFLTVSTDYNPSNKKKKSLPKGSNGVTLAKKIKKGPIKQQAVPNMVENVRHVYGIPLQPRQLNNGVGTTCEGCGKPCDMNASEPILLCDGKGCSNEYHLKCVKPPLKCVPKGDFFCDHCDSYGTSMHLQEYFETCCDARSEFPSSKLFVKALLNIHLNNEVDALLNLDERGNKEEHKLETDSEVEVMERQLEHPDKFDIGDKLEAKLRELVSTQDTTHNTKKNSIQECPPGSEIDKISIIHNAAMNDDNFKAKDKDKSDEEKENSYKYIPNDVSPDFLVGKGFRLYCPVDNTYHIGRIIDWRTGLTVEDTLTNNDPRIVKNRLFYGNGKIGSTEFLVRFQAGLNGRKKTIHQWLIFEEHSCAICAFIVIGHKDRGRGVNGWRPAQILLRSSMELVPLRNDIQTSGCWGLGAFVGDGSHVYLDLEEETVGLFSKRFADYKMKKLRSTHAKHQDFHDKIVESTMSMAYLELEEQRRTFEWHKLHVQNPAHPHAITIKDEYSIDPVIFSQSRKTEAIHIVDERGNATKNFLQLCPLIQQSIDRHWLASQITDEGGVEKSLDTLGSFKCSFTQSTSAKIAALKMKR